MSEQTFNLVGLQEAFRLGGGFATGDTINAFAAETPAELERQGWLVKSKCGRYLNGYKAGPRLKELYNQPKEAPNAPIGHYGAGNGIVEGDIKL